MNAEELKALLSEAAHELEELAWTLEREAENYREDDGTYQPHGLKLWSAAKRARILIKRARSAKK